jgi:hypothetical protein
MQHNRKQQMMAQTSATGGAMRGLATVTALAAALCGLSAQAQNFPITPGQKSTAEQVAQTGVPLSELAPNAPDNYTVKSGDTLWAISGLFLKSPWRWPELWGMNIQEIRNPHRIFPGQQLFLDKSNGRARLRMGAGLGAEGEAPTQTVRVSPRTRYETLADTSIPTLQTNLIEPFLAEPVIVNQGVLESAPRIVATQEGRVLVSRGDRAYAMGTAQTPLVDANDKPRDFRVFRNATALRDPVTRAVLGYEAQYVGKATLVRGESMRDVPTRDGKSEPVPVPATIDIVASKEEMRTGDRLLPEPPRQLISYVPRAPETRVEGAVVSMYGSTVANAAQNQIVVINKGTADGIESGHVLAILKDGRGLVDRTGDKPTVIKLPDERNGLLMVFRPFEKLSYALILEITDGVKVGDRVVNPR